uniref:Uncharacterized protein n=1 Tax=Arundo donax TaxID=35708 RepID=A0A0A9BVW9_ARUDO
MIGYRLQNSLISRVVSLDKSNLFMFT